MPNTPEEIVQMPKQHWINILNTLRSKLDTENQFLSSDVPPLIAQLYYIVYENDDLSDYNDDDILLVKSNSVLEEEPV